VSALERLLLATAGAESWELLLLLHHYITVSDLTATATGSLV